MANPEGHVVLGEQKAHATKARYTALEAELQAMRQCNEELTCRLLEQEEMVAAERL